MSWQYLDTFPKRIDKEYKEKCENLVFAREKLNKRRSPYWDKLPYLILYDSNEHILLVKPIKVKQKSRVYNLKTKVEGEE